MFLRASQGRRQVTRDEVFPAPSGGWVQSGNITVARRDQAEVLDNLFPTAQSARLRAGCEEYALLPDPVRRLMVYSAATDDLFASTDDGVYDADRIAAGGDDFADLAGLNGGDWSAIQTSTTAGDYMVMANGTDPMFYWTGATFNPINTGVINNVGYDALTAAFTVGETVTAGGASATIIAITQISATAGVLKVGPITSGPFTDNAALTSAGGAATVNGASSSASLITITGIATTALTQLWLYGSRIFAIEKDSMSAWYLPVGSIGGAATELPLGALFAGGGRLLFGATWSQDTGGGYDDLCVFVTTEGEVAVFSGGDPSSVETWVKVGVYQLARPLNKHASFKAGGDLAILTEDGIVPLSAALSKDRAALQETAITVQIEDAWRAAVANRSVDFPITATLWQAQTMLLVGVPKSVTSVTQAFVANARTGAWCRYTGWDVRCSIVSDDRLYFGNEAGQVMRAEEGGSDAGVEYSGVYVPKFQEFGYPGIKMANHAAITYRTSSPAPHFVLVGLEDYRLRSLPPVEPLAPPNVTTWGTGVWGTFIWGATGEEVPEVTWKTIRAIGYAISYGFKVTANQTNAPALELLGSRIRYEASGGI
jgi:hypothetical protein